MSLLLMGKKKGMTQIFDPKGNLVVCTVIALSPNVVVQLKTKEVDGYEAVQLGAEKLSSSRKKNVTKPLSGHFAKAGVSPMDILKESPLGDGAEYQVGQEIGVDYFDEGAFVDIRGRSKGKGYQGVMKRHGFKGGPSAHGSGFHRHAGSTGMCSSPGRTFKGLKMAGQMGNAWVTAENLEVVAIDMEKGVMMVKGAVPGSRGGTLILRKSPKKPSKVGA